MRLFLKSKLTWCLVFLLGLGMVIFLGGCDSDDDGEHEHTEVPAHEHEAEMPDPPTPMAPSEALKRQVVEANAMIAYEGYKAAWSAMTHFREDLMYFEMGPGDDDALKHQRESWLAAREVYQPTEIYRFRLGPIDTLNDDGTIGEDGDGPELRINGWPLGEAFIDYTYCGPTDGSTDSGRTDVDEGDPAQCGEEDVILGGIIADTVGVPAINVETLKTDLAVMTGDEFDVATGYHAIEFLLWGQDLNYFDLKEGGWSAGTDPDYRDWTPGDRPASDFFYSDDAASKDGDGNPQPCTSGPVEHDDRTACQRRMAYLKAATDLLIQDLKNVVDAWDPDGTNNYYDTFTDPANTDESLAKILEGMGRMAFGELAGERITIAVLTKDQEEEHSCFSDNTHRDIYLNVVGVQNMFLGDYNPLETQDYTDHRLGIFTRSHFGPGIYDLLLSAAPDVAQALMDAIDLALAEAGEIDALAKGAKPFDVQILENDPNDDVQTAVERIITALGEVRLQIEAAIVALELTTGDLRQDTCETVGGIPGTGEDCPQASS